MVCGQLSGDQDFHPQALPLGPSLEQRSLRLPAECAAAGGGNRAGVLGGSGSKPPTVKFTLTSGGFCFSA